MGDHIYYFRMDPPAVFNDSRQILKTAKNFVILFYKKKLYCTFNPPKTLILFILQALKWFKLFFSLVKMFEHLASGNVWAYENPHAF